MSTEDDDVDLQSKTPTPIAPSGQRMLMSPREEILEDINNREQRLLDKLAILRGFRRLVECGTLDQVEKILEVHRLEQQLYWLKD